jgi:3-oxoacyl-(acyl-carrier-protein) synthase
MGIGLVSYLGNDVNTVWERLMDLKDIGTEQNIISFDSGIELNRKKKANRYSEMGIYVSKYALADAELELDKINKNRIGTIFTTGYGPMNSALNFAESIAKKDWEYCSPVVFANTVNNACVGHICMTFGLKGVSTVLMASNNLTYSQLLLNTDKADFILTGAIEEYCEELYNALKTRKSLKSLFLSEGAVSFLVKNGRDSKSYCSIADIEECSIGRYPLTDTIEEKKVYSKMKELANKLARAYEIDAFFSSNNETYFDHVETGAIQEVLNKDTIYVNGVKHIFGETLGASFNMNIMVAALCIKNGKLPLKLDSRQRNIRCAMVSGYDVSGNYLLAVLENS